MSKPQTRPPVIYFLTVVSKVTKTRHYCKTIAFSYEEAFNRAKARYGAIRVPSETIGTCVLPNPPEVVHTSGEFLSSPNDHYLHPAALAVICAK